ncbi:hypothetical protein L2E82_10784 [Cichorium intybus]|uniref:Uncharacterized protein n=1 Tax=Cichorium intybus TaxID=13427 RepID=A0ACB9GC71_CICIN|nr:hypothetical protein L2E82_10784 [Cichorium intybus]
MVEDYEQAVSVANLGGIRDTHVLHTNLGLKNSPQVCEALEHRLVVAEAAQRLRLPLISKDGEVHEDGIEKWSGLSSGSPDSTIGGVPNQFLGITRAYLWQSQVQHAPLPMDVGEYQMPLLREIEIRLKAKCDKLGDACIDDLDSSRCSQNSSARLPERMNYKRLGCAKGVKP